jgi:MYXO-CTERM domain-containing protein
MRRFAPLALLVAASSIVAVSSAQPTVTTRVDRGLPAMLRGELTPPSSDRPLSIALEALRRHATWATRLELAHVDTAKLEGGGSVVSFQQAIDGVPVLERGVRVTIESDGRATAIATKLEENRPLSMVPTITEKGALAEAARLGVPASKLGARLMILPNGNAPMLVWGVIGDLGVIPSRPVVLLDAQTGEVALSYDAAITLKKAKVYANNPVKTPTTTEVTLTNDATLPGLENVVVKAVNCIDKKTVKDVTFGGFPLKVHVCDLEPTIAPDSTGDYLAVAPILSGVGAAEDKYAELSMFYHTDKAYEFVRKVGYPESKVVKINAVANLRIPQGMQPFDIAKVSNPELALVAFDNAFFAAQDPLLSTTFGLEGDAMWFGQGTLADFGYDGDVVYHEFGHFVVSRTIKLGGGTWADEFGLSVSPGGLNESIADIVSFFITDDPELGEYTTTGLGLPKGKGMRSGLNTFKFPEAITGEVHQDAEPHSAAIWAVYATLDATKKLAFQKAFMKTLLTAPQGNLGYADFAELVIRDVTAGVDAAAGTALRAAYEERGIKKGEPRVRTFADRPIASVDSRLGIHAPGKNDMVGGNRAAFAPGLFQIGYNAPAGGLTKIHVTYELLTRGGTFGTGSGNPLGGPSGTPYTPALLVKVSDEPIKFTYGAAFGHDAIEPIDCVVAADKKTATCDVEVEVPGTWGQTGKVHLMLVNKGQQAGDFDGVNVTSEPPPEPPAPEQPAAQPTTTTTETSCGCTIPGATSNGTAATFALAALGLILAKRRRS